MHSRNASHLVLVTDLPDTITEDIISRYDALKLKYVRCEWTQEIFLKKAGVPEAKTVIILPDESLGDPLETTDVLSADTSALDEFITRKFSEAGLDSSERARTYSRLNPSRNSLIDKDDMAVIVAGGSS